MPTELEGVDPRDMSMMFQHLDQINRQGAAATALSETKAYNRQAYQEMLRRQRELQRARSDYRTARSNQPAAGGLFYGNYEGSRNFAKKWGKDNTPEVSDIKKLRPNAPITTVNWRGHSFGVNRQVAPIFVALLDDLWKAGYRTKSIGGHADRNIAGTNTPSLHSYGFAIDIDPNLNPVQYGSNRHALPSNVGALAAKYGLSWGGDWQGSKKDPMHFSVAYGGTK